MEPGTAQISEPNAVQAADALIQCSVVAKVFFRVIDSPISSPTGNVKL